MIGLGSARVLRSGQPPITAGVKNRDGTDASNGVRGQRIRPGRTDRHSETAEVADYRLRDPLYSRSGDLGIGRTETV